MEERRNRPYTIPNAGIRLKISIYWLELELLISRNLQAVVERAKVEDNGELGWYKAIVEGKDTKKTIMHRTHDKSDCNVFNYKIADSNTGNAMQRDGHYTHECTRFVCGTKFKCLWSCGKESCAKCNKTQISQLGYLEGDYNTYFNKTN